MLAAPIVLVAMAVPMSVPVIRRLAAARRALVEARRKILAGHKAGVGIQAGGLDFPPGMLAARARMVVATHSDQSIDELAA